MEFMKSFCHPEEVFALVRYKVAGLGDNHVKTARSPGMQKCYEYLKLTSRSFAAVIEGLDDDLRDEVCIFYLVLRALDTLEDDMSIPVDTKTALLHSFHTRLQDPAWSYSTSMEKDRIVLEDFPTISREFRARQPLYRDVISDICARMGAGMNAFLLRAPNSLLEWDEYCHYVAGLVGIGLSRIFSGSRLESRLVGEDTRLSNSMGLFLQKTNIIRDFLEDVLQGRQFWPREVWSKHCVALVDLAQVEHRAAALACLNELITNALGHVPDVLTYLARLNNQSVFGFCAIPQVMAIATLERCYDNARVFSAVVKIRKGETVRLMQQATSIESVKAIFTHFVSKIRDRIPPTDPSAERTAAAVAAALSVSHTKLVYTSTSVTYLPLYVSAAMLIAAILWSLWTVLMWQPTDSTEHQ